MQTPQPVVFFDRDGTLNFDAGYTHRPEDLRWRPGAIAAVREVNARGWRAVVITNQAGIGRGLYDEAAMHRFHAHMQAELSAEGARIDAFYFCPFHADAVIERFRHPNHPDRKPNPGMILRALADLNADPARALMLGDGEHDVAAARAAGIAGALLGADEDVRDALVAALAGLGWAG